MKTFVKETTCLQGIEHGWGNGYVLIPIGYPLHGKNYYDIDVDVHGGLTFSKNAADLDWPEISSEDKECWVIGFDTSHYKDSIENWPKEEVEEETIRLAEQIENKNYQIIIN